ncbi:MAG: FAD-binding domain-containing protein [Roseobacter sp.]
MKAIDLFPPTRTAALERLSAFLPRAGRAYAAGRNTDAGPGQHSAVSTLSPYLRTRLVTEEEVLEATLRRHSMQAAEKFVQEVFWRTYWKGWLEQRPGVWDAYLTELNSDWDAVQTQSGLRDRWTAACTGETEIKCFNFWAQELVETGYLHNHARMWFASIWIFTLQLPWSLGADFFLRHLLDGDPASNTLGWRWVAGLQTRGKTYLARPSNIAKFTNGRCIPPAGQLASEALPLEGPLAPAPRMIPSPTAPAPGKRTGLILHEDDLNPGFVLDHVTPVTTIYLKSSVSGPLQPAPHVAAFREAAAQDTMARWREKLGNDFQVANTHEDIAHWAAQASLEQIVTPYAPTGPVATRLASLAKAQGIPPIVPLMRAYDQTAWPHATKGFFPFKAKIPQMIATLGLG